MIKLEDEKKLKLGDNEMMDCSRKEEDDEAVLVLINSG